MRRVGFPADIANDAPTAPASLTNFEHSDAKTVAGRHATADDWCAIRAHDHAVIRPARSGKIESSRAHMRLELCRATEVRKAERFRIHRAAPNENGQATSGPAVLVESGVHIDHQALPQTAYLRRRILQEPSMMLRPCPPSGTTCGVTPGLVDWRQLSPHCVIAAVDVQELACGHVEVVRKQRTRGAPDR